jgi:hypothetical protein
VQHKAVRNDVTDGRRLGQMFHSLEEQWAEGAQDSIGAAQLCRAVVKR